MFIQDDIPGFLLEVATRLEKQSKSIDQLNLESSQSARTSQHHGRGRASTAGYLIQVVMLEYRILRRVIFEVMEEDTPLLKDEREIILDLIETSKELAATEFSDALRDI